MGKFDVYVPSNILNFKCQMCGKCCKTNWEIAVIKHEYDYLEELFKKNGLEEEFNKSLVVVDKGERMYAKFINKCGKCVFLNENNLCSKQLRFGEDSLTRTCHNYPKEFIITPRGMEVWMHYSCDAALKTLDTFDTIKLLKNPNGLKLKYEDVNNCSSMHKDLTEFYYLLEDFILLVLQNRDLSICDRLILLSYITSKTLGISLEQQNLLYILETLEKTQKIMNNKELIQEMSQMKGNLEIQFVLIASILNGREENKIITSNLNEILEEFEIKESNELLSVLPNKFFNEYEKRYKPYESEYQNIIENYICQTVFRKIFTRTIQRGFFIASAYYVLIRFISVYLCKKNNTNLNKEILLESIKVVDTGFSHNEYLHKLYDKLISVNKFDVPAMISMFKM